MYFLTSLLVFCITGVNTADSQGDTKECYVCLPSAEGCKDPFNPNSDGVTRTTCSGMCGKLKHHGQDSIGRVCMPANPRPECHERIEKEPDAKQTICFCDGHLCNKARIHTISNMAIFLILVVLFMHFSESK